VTPLQLQLTEAQHQEAVIDLARACGWLVYHTLNSRGSESGFPDLVLVRGARLVFAELKSERGKVKPDQQVWLDALAVVKGSYDETVEDIVEVYLWRPSDWREIEQVLAR